MTHSLRFDNKEKNNKMFRLIPMELSGLGFDFDLALTGERSSHQFTKQIVGGCTTEFLVKVTNRCPDGS